MKVYDHGVEKTPEELKKIIADQLSDDNAMKIIGESSYRNANIPEEKRKELAAHILLACFETVKGYDTGCGICDPDDFGLDLIFEYTEVEGMNNNKFAPKDTENDILPKKLEPLIQLSDDGKIYILRAEWTVEYHNGQISDRTQIEYYIRRSNAIGRIQAFVNDIGLGIDDLLRYLALDVYYGRVRSTLESTVIVDKRSVVE